MGIVGRVMEEEICEIMDDRGGGFGASSESLDDEVELHFRETTEEAILEFHIEREQEMARLRVFHDDHLQEHRQLEVQERNYQVHEPGDSRSDNFGFESTMEVSGDGSNLGLREGLAQRETYCFFEGSSDGQDEFHDRDRGLALEQYAMEGRALAQERDGQGMVSETGEQEKEGEHLMEKEAVFGALAAAAVAVNVALQSISGAGSIALNPTSCFDHRRFRKRRRKDDEETDFVPAVLSTFADTELLASSSAADSPREKNPFLFDDLDWFLKPRSKRWWRKLFRVSKPTFDYICQLVKPDIESDTPESFQGIEGRVITVEKQVAIALRRLASGDSLTALGEFFGVGESTVSKVIWKFVNSMEKRARHHMQWPEGEEMERVKAGFEVDHGLPNCCGVIGLTHILMELPGTDSSIDWLDREQNYSMLVQVVVDMDMKIRDLFTGWPGSKTDSGLLRNSSFYAVCESGERLNGPSRTVEGIQVREHIVGDSGYPLLPWLVNPYSSTGSSPSRGTFNTTHAATKEVVEDALGRLKGAWKILHKVLWRPDIRKLPKIILVCCLLHNILIEAGEDLEDGVALVGYHDEGYRQQWCLLVEPGGHVIREALAEHVFSSDHR